VDSHLHLDFDRFDNDRTEVIQRAVDGGITKMITIGIDLPTSEAAIKLAETHPAVYAAVGLHPTEAQKFDDTTVAVLKELAQHDKVVAIGEVGLDYYWKETPADVQHLVFRNMIQLANELDLPLIIHNRESSSDIIAILNEEKTLLSNNRITGVMHCFSGDTQMLDDSLKLEFHISFAGNLTYKKSNLPELVASIPSERLLVETDAPFLAPVPKRGKRNEPAYTKLVAEKLAEILGCDYSWIAEQTTKNAHSLFRKLNDNPE